MTSSHESDWAMSKVPLPLTEQEKQDLHNRLKALRESAERLALHKQND